MKERPQKKTILVVEDDPDVLSVLVKHLEKMGYEVLAASDGLEGLKRLESGGYDLVITDIVMPYMSGLGVVTAIKQKAAHIPVIVITGFGKEPELAATEKKADLVLAKPFSISVLREHIARLLMDKEDSK